MVWLQHLFALCVLAHMLWAAVLLQKEWQRIHWRGQQGHPRQRDELAGAVAAPKAGQPNVQ